MKQKLNKSERLVWTLTFIFVMCCVALCAYFRWQCFKRLHPEGSVFDFIMMS